MNTGFYKPLVLFREIICFWFTSVIWIPKILCMWYCRFWTNIVCWERRGWAFDKCYVFVSLKGSLSKHEVDEKCDIAFLQSFSIIQTHYVWKMCSNYHGIKLEPALGTWEDKLEHLSSYFHLIHTTAKQVISRRRKDANVYKMSKMKNAPCKKYCFSLSNRQICGVFVAVVVVVA